MSTPGLLGENKREFVDRCADHGRPSTVWHQIGGGVLPEQWAMFETVEQVILGDYDVLTVPPGTKATDTLKLMLDNRYSQIPVVDGDQVVGVFSLWSLAAHLHNSPRIAIEKLEVGDLVEPLPTVTVEDSLHSVFHLLSKEEALLVDSPQGLQAITTAWDFLAYFYRIAHPYILLREIELSLRELIRRCAPDEQLADAARVALQKKYKNLGKGTVPTNLHEMTFDDYRAIVDNKTNWPLFEGVLGRNRELVGSRLSKLRDIRNDVFHFRAEQLDGADHTALASSREWLLRAAGRLPDRSEVL